MAKSNRKIDQIIAFGKWEIEPTFALSALYQYLEDLDLLELNVSEEVKADYSKRRQELAPVIWCQGLQVSEGYNSLASQEIPANSIAHIRMDGVMRLQDGLSSRGIRQVAADLKAADSNPNIQGILFEVNSGGGEVMAGTFLQNTMKEVKKPVYVWGHTLASAAYKGAIPANKIILSGQDAEAGSIGSMLVIDKRLIQYFRENQEEIYSRTSGNKNKEWRSYLQGNIEPMVQAITERNEAFIEAVKSHRNLTGDTAQITDTLSGHLFMAKDAIQRGLVDDVGTFEQVMDQLTENIISKDQISFTYSSQLNKNVMDKTLLQRISTAVNRALGISVDVQAEPDATKAGEQLAEAIEKAQSIEDIKKDLVAQVTDAVMGELQGTENKGLKDLQAAIETSQAAQAKTLKDLQNEIAVLKGQKPTEGEPAKQDAAPDPSQFQTVNNFNRTVTPEGTTSKF